MLFRRNMKVSQESNPCSALICTQIWPESLKMLAQQHCNKLFKVLRLIIGHYSNAFAIRVQLTEDTPYMGVDELSYMIL